MYFFGKICRNVREQMCRGFVYIVRFNDFIQILCFFFEDFKIFRTLAFALFSLGVSVCTHTPGR